MPATDASSLAAARTLLFVPGDRPDRFEKAASSGADGIVLDLEDAVPNARKREARENVRLWRTAGGAGVVRVNAVGSPWHVDDIAALGDGPGAVMIPKASSADEIDAVLERLHDGSCVIPILETAVGVLDARSVCSAAGVVRVAFGNGDLARELGVHHANLTALAWARSAVVLASAAAGVAPPLDGVTTAVDDTGALRADTRHAAELGFTGRLCIHPRQVSVIHETLRPTEEDLRRAREIVAAADDGAAALVGGEMIDTPVIERARLILRLHGD